ncbi:hypothetical protein E2C05_13445 [Paracraurococcus ruber]|uniref:Uncharacterized protein n=2 Tax=Paracraurococcus ruber TaxID=77675 RepID=A0ABS1CVA7_9PROT|nr:hypothetical protein [Paracraurococcus ruber]TDG30726.1 hypothetical protein E2C05_13445 [Paracraurococcus ruber]
MRTGEHRHGPYLVRTHPAKGGRYRGRAMRAGVILFDATAPTEAEVVARLRALLDEREAAAGRDPENRIPMPADYAAAFRRLDAAIGPGRRRMLRALYEAPGRTLTATQLAAAAGYPNDTTANLQFGLLGQAIADDLGMILPKRPDGAPTSTASPVQGPDGQRDGDFPWTMRPQVAAAIGLLPPAFLHG